MADGYRNPADTSELNRRSADWYEPAVQARWSAQSGTPCPPYITSDRVYGHVVWDEENGVYVPGEPYTAYYDDPFDDSESDVTPPELTVQISGTQNGDGFYIAEAVVAIMASDVSGVDYIEYKIDDDPDWTTYENPFIVSGEGEHTVTFRAADLAGNISEPDDITFEIVAADETPPSVMASLSGDQDGEGNYIDQVTVTLSATDA